MSSHPFFASKPNGGKSSASASHKRARDVGSSSSSRGSSSNNKHSRQSSSKQHSKKKHNQARRDDDDEEDEDEDDEEEGEGEREGDKVEGKSQSKSLCVSVDVALPTTNSDSVGLQRLSSWFEAHHFQGLQHLSFQPSPTCSHSLGCFAKKDFAVGELLFAVPQSVILGLGPVMDHPIANFLFHEAKKHQCFQRVTIELLIWLVMIDGKYRDHELDGDDDDDDDGDGSYPPIHTYLTSLSDPSPSLLNWDPKLLSIVANTNLGNSLTELETVLKNHVELLKDLRKWNRKVSEHLLPSNYFNYDNLVWACGHYLSRRYPGQFANQTYKDLTVDDNKFGRENNMGNVGALVPLLDILNHNHEQEYLKFEVKNSTLQVICNYPVKAGDELYSNYGALSNEQLLFAYGYSVAENANDVFAVKLKLPSVMPATIGNKKRGSVEAISKVFELRPGGWEGISKDIFEALATLTQASDPTYVPTPNEAGVYENECCILLDYLMASILKMSLSQREKCDLLAKFGVELSMKFPTDAHQDGQSEAEEELVLDEDSLVPHGVISMISTSNVVANNERAKFLAFYLLGQYQIVMTAAHDLNEMVGDDDGDDEDEDEEDDEDEDEEDDEDEDGEEEDDEDGNEN